MSIPQIIINGRFLTQKKSGVQVFAESITRELIQPFPDLKIAIPANAEIINKSFEDRLLKAGKFQGHLWEQLDLPSLIRKNPGSILLNLCNTAPVGKILQAVTIHDLAVLKNPDWFNWKFRSWYRFLIPRIIKNSKHVFTVSNAVKSELIATFNISGEHISVLPNKVDEELLGISESKPANSDLISGKYFLMVGSDDPRKNFIITEKIFSEGYADYKLVIAGGSHRSFGSGEHINHPSIIRLGYISDPELKWLYRNAVALINPSLYEGFGIPNLESFAFNCPVVCSDIPVFREICRQAAFYFNPQDEDSLKKAIAAVTENIALTESKTIEGKSIFTDFQKTDRALMIKNSLFQ